MPPPKTEDEARVQELAGVLNVPLGLRMIHFFEQLVGALVFKQCIQMRASPSQKAAGTYLQTSDHGDNQSQSMTMGYNNTLSGPLPAVSVLTDPMFVVPSPLLYSTCVSSSYPASELPVKVGTNPNVLAHGKFVPDPKDPAHCRLRAFLDSAGLRHHPDASWSFFRHNFSCLLVWVVEVAGMKQGIYICAPGGPDGGAADKRNMREKRRQARKLQEQQQQPASSVCTGVPIPEAP